MMITSHNSTVLRYGVELVLSLPKDALASGNRFAGSQTVVGSAIQDRLFWR